MKILFTLTWSLCSALGFQRLCCWDSFAPLSILPEEPKSLFLCVCLLLFLSYWLPSVLCFPFLARHLSSGTAHRISGLASVHPLASAEQGCAFQVARKTPLSGVRRWRICICAERSERFICQSFARWLMTIHTLFLSLEDL